MFKRANKITALLVAAASVMSLVPAMAADSTRLGTKDGTINDAIAYKDGKYAYEGYKTDADNKSVYYNDGTKDKEINDLTDARINENSKYDASSTISWDGNDEYLLDLSTGKVTDDDVASDLQSTAADKLTAKLKKTDRYGENVSVALERIAPSQFGDVWYSYTGTKADAAGTVKAIVTGTIPTGAYTSDIVLGGKTFGAPSVGSVTKYSNLVLSAGTSGGTLDKFAALKLGGVDIIAAGASQTDLATAINTTKKADLVAAGYDVAVVSSVAISGAQTTTLSVQNANVGKTTAANGDFVYLKSGDSKQVQVGLLPTDLGSNKVKGFTSEADLINQIKNTDFDNFTASASAVTAGGVSVVFTQKAATNYVQADANADFNDASGTTYTATRVGVGSTGSTTTNVYNGYTNKSAAYIDADKTANIRVYNGSKMVKVDEFDQDDFTDGIKASVIKDSSITVAQDKDYIYRIVDVKFTTDANTYVYDSKGIAVLPSNTAKYLQKISKAQGTTEKDAYLPKNVESYEITKSINEGDETTAYERLANYVANVDKDNVIDKTSNVVGIRAVDGTLYYTEMDNSTKVKTYKLKLSKNEKLTLAGTTNTKVDAYVLKKDGDKDHDLKGQAGKDGASLDVDGNLWIINEGKILKSEKAGDFTEVFTVDRSIDSLDVYNKESLVAWDGDGNVYTTNQEGTKVTAAEATVVAPVVVTNNWIKGTDGTWTFNDATGTKIVSKWINYAGAWYFLKADGVMATNWYNDNGTWYHLNASGAMSTGWFNDNGTWYYLNASGAMLANTTVDGYVLNASGAWVK